MEIPYPLVFFSNTHFKGEFWENPERVEILKEELQTKLKWLEVHKDSSEGADLEWLRKNIEADSKKYPFGMDLFSFDKETGLFLADGNDQFGHSKIIGAGEYDELKFSKIYRKPGSNLMNPVTFSNDTTNLRVFDYHGKIFTKNGKLEALGTYTRHGNEKIKHGFWYMEPVLK